MPRQNAARSMSLTSQESYSAVIIADLVAEVQTPPEDIDIEKGRKNSTKSEKSVKLSSSAARKMKDNLGYDGQTDATPPAVINVDTMDTINSNRSNGTEISKGVILNAQFGPLSKKGENNLTEKSIEMNNALPVQASDAKKEAKSEVSTDFKHMSTPRKVAFIFSFLPSIMFVLCFAVILPCEKKLPCIEEMWSLSLNDIEVTTRVYLSSEKLFYSYVQGSSGSKGLISLDVESGNQAWNSSLSYAPYLQGCDKLVENRSEACLVTGDSGRFELFNVSSGIGLRQMNVNSTDNPPMFRYEPVILPDCLGDGISEYGFVVSHNEIKVVYQGYISSSLSISSCDTAPEKLTPWTTEDKQTDLVFTCRKDGKDQLIRMPQSTWCTFKNEGTVESETSLLGTRSTGSFDGAQFLPTPRGLVFWDQDEITFFGLSGEKNWTVSTEPHFDLNRFLLHGKFGDAGSQIALFSNNVSSTLQVSLLDYESGEVTWNKTIANAEVFDIALMEGEKKDFVLMMQRKVERDLKAEAVSHLTEVPTTLISMLSEEAAAVVADAPTTTLVDELVFMELATNYYQSVDEKTIKYDEGKYYKGKITVVHRPNNEIAIVTLKQSETKIPHTMLRSISVRNWDISLTENRQCSWSA